MAHIHLFLYGKRRHMIEVPENISQMDIRSRASPLFQGGVRTVPEVFPPRDDTIVHCIPSFVPETWHPDKFKYTVVPYLLHHEKRYPIEIWLNISPEDLANGASNITRGPCRVHDSTMYPVKTDDEIVIATEQEVRLVEITFAALRKDGEIKAQAQTVPTMRQLALQTPPWTVSREALLSSRAFHPPTPSS
jgi:hypothetical protein